jgi:hypothetical protein
VGLADAASSLERWVPLLCRSHLDFSAILLANGVMNGPLNANQKVESLQNNAIGPELLFQFLWQPYGRAAEGR